MFRTIISRLMAAVALISLVAACAPATATPTEAVGQPDATLVPSPTGVQPTNILEPTNTPQPTATLAPLVHLKVGILPFASFAPLFIAQEAGYFAEQRLEVEFVTFATGGEMSVAIAQHAVDIAGNALTAGTFSGILQGSGVKYVADKAYAKLGACPADAYLVTQAVLDSGVYNDLANLRGKKIVSLRGYPYEYALDLLLAQGGLTQADIEWTEIKDLPTRIEALKNGAVDAILISEPWITRAAKMDAGVVWKSLADVLPNMPVGGIVYGPSVLENPEVGNRFAVAYLKAIREYNLGKTQQTAEIISKYTRLTVDEIRESCWASFRDDGKMDTQGMLDFVNWAVSKDYVASPLTVDQFYDPSFIDYANEVLK